jgi:hypothetical protein
MESLFKFDLGEEVTATPGGFTGVIVSRTEFMYGCVRYNVEATTSDNDIKSFHFDEDALASTAVPDVHTPKAERVRTGGDRPAVPRTGR